MDELAHIQDEDGLYLWEYHPDEETYLWYSRFRDYYLSQPTPRRTVQSYRLYRIAESGYSEMEADKLAVESGAWSMASRGFRSSSAKKRWKSWKERADAYDQWLQRNIDSMMLDRRRRSASVSLGRIDRLSEKWDEFMGVASVLKKTSVRRIPQYETDPETGEQTIVGYREVETHALNTGQFRSLIRALNDIRTMERRELGLAERIHQNNIADNEGDKLDLSGGMADVFAQELKKLQDEERTAREADDGGDSDDR